jgi:hypothetical protein
MMGNTKNYKEKETIKERGTKRFRERVVEEKEAEKEIKDYERDLPVETNDEPVEHPL